MRAVALSSIAVLLLLAAAAGVHAAGPSCQYNGHDLSVIPDAVLSIPLVQPPSPDETAMNWQISLCSTDTVTWCSSQSTGYVVSMTSENGAGQCVSAFNNYTSWWSTAPTGDAVATMQATVLGAPQYIQVTLACDPSATTLQAIGNVKATGGVLSMRLGTNAICGAAPPVPPPAPTPSTQPQPPAPGPSSPSATVNVCTGAQCAGSTCTRTSLPTGVCTPTQSGGSRLISCNATAANIVQWSAPNCDGWPASSKSYVRGECYELPVIGGSFEVLGCSN